MTKEDIIRLAREADVWVVEQEPYQSQLERFAQLVAAAEREACAKVADEWIKAYPHPSERIAEMIRARDKA